LAIFGLTRRSFNDAKTASSGDGRGQLRASNPAHRGLQDGVLGTRVGQDSVCVET